MKFDLSRLTPTSFEQMIRALAFQELGLPGVVFSMGPDGGRDFNYSGAVPAYQSRGWNGYLVLQAKYRMPSSQTPEVEWLLREISKEIEKLKKNESAIKIPDYYIIATNVNLSGSDTVLSNGKRRSGGYKKLHDFMQENLKAVGVRDFDIWSNDKICDLIANNPNIRRSFAAWVTPGDVLSKMLDSIDAITPQFKEIIGRSLKASLNRDQYVRLRDAGSVADQQIRTSQVFVDLPLAGNDRSQRRYWISHAKRNPHSVTSHGIVNAAAKIIERAKEKLDPESLVTKMNSGKREYHSKLGNIVLIGGPGQGKSTATLFVTQIFRAAILENDSATARNHSISLLVPEILKRAEAAGISPNIPCRYPIHISLPKLADQCSQAKIKNIRMPTIISHISNELSDQSDQEVSTTDVRRWMKEYPWMVVLDGLDEVPPSGERPALLEAIANFKIEISEANADVLCVVTTRPQGYNHDLDPDLWDHWRLDELTPEEALSYADAFGVARYPDDRARRESVLRLLGDAALQPATAKLMISPLQITILYFIVDTGGGVPAARWTLFNEYFEVLKKRERAKGGRIQAVIERHWGQIGPIHQRAGLILQVDSEYRGNAGSKLSHERFKRLIRNYLFSEGFTSAESDERADEIAEIACNRLVLLSTQEEGYVTFDVRSLQEFMAASALTSCEIGDMESRLLHIATKSHWRHVFLIAASRCFAEDAFHHRRSIIIAIIRKMDTELPDSTVKSGAKLALDLLSDGIGVDHPISRKPLLINTLELFFLGSANFDERLATIWHVNNLSILEQFIFEHAGNISRPVYNAIWKCLFLMSRATDWATDVILNIWPTNIEAALISINEAEVPLANRKIAHKIKSVLSLVGPDCISQIPEFCGSVMQYESDEFDEEHGAFHTMIVGGDEERRSLEIPIFDQKSSLVVAPYGLSSYAGFRAFQKLEQAADSWRPFILAAGFLAKPSQQHLSDVLYDIASTSFEAARKFSWRLPWLISSLVEEANGDPEKLRQIAGSVRRGDKGNLSKWKAAESRWLRKGVTISDLSGTENGLWFKGNVQEYGSPQLARFRGRGGETALEQLHALIAVINKCPTSDIRRTLVGMLQFIVCESMPLNELNREDLVVSSMSLLSELNSVYGVLLDSVDWNVLKNDAASDAIDRIIPKCEDLELLRTPDIELILNALARRPGNRNIIALLAVAGIEADRETLNSLISKTPEEFKNSRDNDSPICKTAISVVRILEGKFTESDLDVISQSISNNFDSLGLSLIECKSLNAKLRIDVILGCINRLNAAGNRSVQLLFEPLRRALDIRRSELTKRHIWVDELKLAADCFECLSVTDENSDNNFAFDSDISSG